MKVLYLSGGKGADYQCDLVMHGLRSLLGPDLVDVAKLNFMYSNWHEYMFHSLYRLLPDIEVDREDVEAKIQSRHYDAIVYGSVHRCRDYMQSVLDTYPANRIVFIDGEDGPELTPAVGHGWYFKRELYEPRPDVLPIQFGIPKEKIRAIDLSRKTRLMAHCDPRDRSTYVYYDSEQRYYDQYSDAFFGYTMKKGGWDCMRHHEIIAAGALPYFADIESCPNGTLTTFSRTFLMETRTMADNWEICVNRMVRWPERMKEMRDSLLTTEDLARLILERVT